VDSTGALPPRSGCTQGEARRKHGTPDVNKDIIRRLSRARPPGVGPIRTGRVSSRTGRVSNETPGAPGGSRTLLQPAGPMRILAVLATLFVVLPVAELALLLRVGRAFGFWPTLGLVLFTGVLGAVLARMEGTRTLEALRSEIARGGLPGRALMDGASVLVGGALLLTPGFLTDGLGFALLFPPTRRFLQGLLRRRIEAGIREGSILVAMSGASPFTPQGARPPHSPHFSSGREDVILDAEVVETRPRSQVFEE